MSESEPTGQGFAYTDEQWGLFLASLMTCGNVTQACTDAGMSRAGVYRRRNEEADIRRAWDEAKKIGLEGLEDEARRRAFDGVLEPKFQVDGVTTTSVRKYSDILLIFLLKGGMPEKYKDRIATEHSGSIDTGFDLSKLPADKLRELRKLLDEARSTPEEPEKE